MSEPEVQQQKKPVKKGLVIGLSLCAITILCALVVLYAQFGPKAVQGSKLVTIEVVDNGAATTTYDIHTDAEFLQQVMEETEGLEFSGTESQYGLMIDTINGTTADYDTDGAYWAFYIAQNGEWIYCSYGMGEQPVLDGDDFRIAYTKD